MINLSANTDDFSNQQAVKIFNEYKLGIDMAIMVAEEFFNEKNISHINHSLQAVKFAQQDFILHHIPSIPQITQVDPASFPDSKQILVYQLFQAYMALHLTLVCIWRFILSRSK